MARGTDGAGARRLIEEVRDGNNPFGDGARRVIGGSRGWWQLGFGTYTGPLGEARNVASGPVATLGGSRRGVAQVVEQRSPKP